MNYQFISKYGSGFSVEVKVGEERIKCPFINAIYETNREDVAQALQRNRYHGSDFYLNVNKQEVTDRFGDSDKLGMKLKGMKRQQLISFATKSKLPDVYKKTKDELINLLLQKPERTEALINEAV